ncbi:MAG: hypothetical protein HOH43_26550 [Candidatus Latescibacteria bacterium]|nr:hypothetical protein [Candidatus Latescibacterota bacterium]
MITSYRAPAIGFLLAILVGLWGEYASNQMGYEFAATQLPSVVLIPFLFLIVLPNISLSYVSSISPLTRSELIIIFAMGFAASMVPDQALTKYLLVVITAPYYFANAENRWEEQFHPYLPEWLVLQNEGESIRRFFEGMEQGQSIPWGIWITPIFWWLSIILVLVFAGACIVVILRRQWVEHERLRFPLGEVVLHLLGTQEDPMHPDEPALLRKPVFRVGFIIMSLIMIWNILSFWGFWPRIPIMAADTSQMFVGQSFPPLTVGMNIFVFCLLFFVNAEVLFSMWAFLVIYNVQSGILSMMGVSSSSGTIVAGGVTGIQSIGGLIAFVLWGMWMARRHIWQVVKQASGRDVGLDETEELFSYRMAVLGLVFGMGYVIFWLAKIGLSLPVMVLFLFLLFVIYLALARVVAEAGIVSLDLPINSHQFSIGIIGSANISHADLTTLGMTNGFARNWRTFTMIGTSHIAWLREFMDAYRRRLFPLCAVAFCTSLLTSLTYLIYAGYTYGAQNLRTDIGSGRGPAFYGLITSWINNATQISELEILFFVSGFVIMILMTAGTYLFHWWPLHPIGMVVVMSAPVTKAFLQIFLAWLIQAILLRIGGWRLYRSAQPLFIGFLVAYLLFQVVSLGVDLMWFPDEPHLWEVY